MDNPAFDLLHSIGARGQYKKQKVFYTEKGVQKVRDYVIPIQPDTPVQLSRRAFFRHGVQYWNDAAQSFRDSYIAEAKEKGLKLHGINLFLKRWLKGEIVSDCIKSIQEGRQICVNGNNDVAISAVETAKSVVIIGTYANAVESAGVVAAASVYGGRLTSTTNLRIEVALLNIPNVPVYWQVVEYY